MRLFYDHLIEKSELVALIQKKAKDKGEEKSLLTTLDEVIHNTVLDVILTHLDEKHHEEFLIMFHKEPHSTGILVWLKQKAHPEIEEKIKEKVKDLKEKILTDSKV